MQYPQSESTPKSKLKPLKSNNEFSSLHKTLRPVKDPLMGPQPLQAPTLRKPNINGGNKVISSLSPPYGQQHQIQPQQKQQLQTQPQQTQHKPPRQKHNAYRPSHATRKEFICQVLPLRNESRVSFPNEVSFSVGDLTVPLDHEMLLEYRICQDRQRYRYAVIQRGKLLSKFDIRSSDHTPFKSECAAHKNVRLSNVGINVPPVSTKVQPLEPASLRTEVDAVLLELEPAYDLAMLGNTVKIQSNSDGMNFVTRPYKNFKWNNTRIADVMHNSGKYSDTLTHFLRLDSAKVTATVGLDNAGYSLLIKDIKRWGNYSPSSSARKHDASESLRPHIFKTIAPTDFYKSSPPQRPAMPFAGSKVPTSASSPKPYEDNMSSPPARPSDGSPRTATSFLDRKGQLTPLKKFLPIETQRTPLKSPQDKVDTSSPGTREDGPGGHENGSSPSVRNGHERSQRNGSDITPFKSPGRQPRARRQVIDYTDPDDELVEPTEEDFALLKAEGFKGVNYQFWDGKQITIEVEDIARLNPRIYVNDNIIWFFLRRYMEKLAVKDPEVTNRILMLDTFFYFTMRNGDHPPAWVSKMHILDKSVVIMPIHEHSHWRVAIIVGLNQWFNNKSAAHAELDSTSRAMQPTIVILDSLAPTRIHPSVRKVVTVLGNVFRAQQRPVPPFSEYRSLRAVVPPQTNSTDCGVFLLHYIEQVLMQLDVFLTKVTEADTRVLDMGGDFWKPEELYSKRESFKRELKLVGNIEEDDQGIDSPTNPTGERRESPVSNEDENAEEEDSIEVLRMEKVVRKKRRVDNEESITRAKRDDTEVQTLNEPPQPRETARETARETQAAAQEIS